MYINWTSDIGYYLDILDILDMIYRRYWIVSITITSIAISGSLSFYSSQYSPEWMSGTPYNNRPGRIFETAMVSLQRCLVFLWRESTRTHKN